MRDAVLAGLTLDTFYRHAHKILAAAAAQLVNCLHSLFFSDGDRFIITPTYHVFAMHADHQGAQSLRTVVSAPRISHTRAWAPTTFWGLQGSASVSRSASFSRWSIQPSPSHAKPRSSCGAVRSRERSGHSSHPATSPPTTRSTHPM
jgi:alpha-N-arabinofuranosidase